MHSNKSNIYKLLPVLTIEQELLNLCALKEIANLQSHLIIRWSGKTVTGSY